jgi:hypothetical protein
MELPIVKEKVQYGVPPLKLNDTQIVFNRVAGFYTYSGFLYLKYERWNIEK